MKRLIGYMLILSSFATYATEPLLAHQHYVLLHGVLPEPYKSFKLEVTLNPENDDVSKLLVNVGKKRIVLGKEQLNQLRNVELGTMQVSHVMGKLPDLPRADLSQTMYIEMQFGNRHRIEYQENGKTQYHWGKDSLEIRIDVERVEVVISTWKLGRYNQCREIISN